VDTFNGSGLSRAPETAEDRIGQVLSRTYRIEELIAVGGMGAVYRASHARLSQPFAVKFLDQVLAKESEAYGRFRQEAEIAAAINHNNVLQVFDFDIDEYGSPYMVMELLQGRTLDVILAEQGALNRREILAIFGPLCSALDACHAAGVVHRDLKPSNIMVCSQADGSVTVKLLDFGISKITHDGNDGMTRDNIVMGTPNYMSPEQASGQNSDLDARADIFAIGAILYEALVGRRAFDADGLPQLLHKIVYKEPESLSHDGIPDRVCEVVEACLQKKPGERLQRAALIGAELKGAYEAQDAKPREKSGGVSPTAVVAASLTAAVLAAALGFGFGSKRASKAAVAGSAVKVGATESPRAKRSAKEPRVSTKSADGYETQVIGSSSARLVSKSGRLYRGDRSSLSYWSDRGANPVTKVLPSAGTVTALRVHDNGKLVAVGQADGWVSVWDHELRGQTWKRKFGSGAVTGVALGKGFVALAQDNKVEFANTTTGKSFKSFTTVEPVRGLFFAPGLDDVLFAFGSNHFMMFDTKKREALDDMSMGGHVVRAGVDEDADGSGPRLWVEFDQGQWFVRRTYRVTRPSREGPVQLSLMDTRWQARP
jgi:serine/threonine-protein kinase